MRTWVIVNLSQRWLRIFNKIFSLLKSFIWWNCLCSKIVWLQSGAHTGICLRGTFSFFTFDLKLIFSTLPGGPDMLLRSQTISVLFVPAWFLKNWFTILLLTVHELSNLLINDSQSELNKIRIIVNISLIFYYFLWTIQLFMDNFVRSERFCISTKMMPISMQSSSKVFRALTFSTKISTKFTKLFYVVFKNIAHVQKNS